MISSGIPTIGSLSADFGGKICSQVKTESALSISRISIVSYDKLRIGNEGNSEWILAS